MSEAPKTSVCEHTPTPWHQGERANFRIVSEGGFTVATVGCDSDLRGAWEANAALIVEAVNNHARLTDELEIARKALAEAIAVIEDTVGYRHSGDPWEENAFDMGELDIHDYSRDGRLEQARAALQGQQK